MKCSLSSNRPMASQFKMMEAILIAGDAVYKICVHIPRKFTWNNRTKLTVAICRNEVSFVFKLTSYILNLHLVREGSITAFDFRWWFMFGRKCVIILVWVGTTYMWLCYIRIWMLHNKINEPSEIHSVRCVNIQKYPAAVL